MEKSQVAQVITRASSVRGQKLRSKTNNVKVELMIFNAS